MDKVNSILSYKRPDKDYYSILGCAPSATFEQILTEYRVRALQAHPDKNLDKPECVEEFRLLQRAKDTLTDSEKRKAYDKWLNSGIAIDFERWLSNNMGQSMHWAPRTSSRLMIDETPTTDLSVRHEFASIARQHNHFNDWNRGNSTLLEKFRNYEI
ncbi:J domain-containing protein, partial [Fragariocoptes setiger]